MSKTNALTKKMEIAIRGELNITLSTSKPVAINHSRDFLIFETSFL